MTDIDKNVTEDIFDELNCLLERMGEAVRACSSAIADKLIACNADTTDAEHLRNCLEAAGCADILKELDKHPFGSKEVIDDVVVCVSRRRG